ncbi:MAG: NusA-like transcription termination signal-binding factor [Candidatus ainarchaeum sp.]|nr:NusA-like transcription termination signal-binding factor [Candidatus ainarchaeum sp.]
MKLGADEIFYLNALNSISGANARDCVVQGNTVSFIVRPGELGRAIGKNALNIEQLKKRLKKNIEIFEYSENAGEFLKKAFYNIEFKKIDSVEEQGKKALVVAVDAENRSKMLNNSGKIKRIKEIAKRNYGIEEIKIR